MEKKVVNFKHVLTSGLGGGFFGVFLYAHIKTLIAGKVSHIGPILFYVFVILLFIFREKPKYVSNAKLHWFYALCGTFTPSLLRPFPRTDELLFYISLPITIIGVSLAIFSLIYLGSSFGIIAARRSVKMTGPYRWIRHPLYLGEAIWFFSVLLQNWSLLNVSIYVINILCQTQRIKEEEKILEKDPLYKSYRLQVKYKLIPYVF